MTLNKKKGVNLLPFTGLSACITIISFFLKMALWYVVSCPSRNLACVVWSDIPTALKTRAFLNCWQGWCIIPGRQYSPYNHQPLRPQPLKEREAVAQSWEGENVVRGGVGEGCRRRSERSPELKAWGVRHGASSLGWMSSRQADSRLKMPLGLALSHPQCLSHSHLLNTHSCVQTATCTKAGKQVGERPGARPRSFFL